MDKMSSCLSRYQDTKLTILLLTCVISFLDETLMTVPVAILPNLFLAQCEAKVAHQELRIPQSVFDGLCYESIGGDIAIICDFNLTASAWNLAYIANNTETKCMLQPVEAICPLFDPRICFEGRVTDTFCSHWRECEENINVKIGIILSAKFVVRILLSLAASLLPVYFGFIPVFYIAVGLGLVSCTVYSVTTEFSFILLARMIHGASASLLVGSSGLLVYAYREDDKKRGVAMGTLIASMALGSVVGPPFGGSFFYLYGVSAPYIILAAAYVTFLGAMFLLLRENPKDESITDNAALNFLRVLLDPYMIIICLGFLFAGSSVSIIESSLPHWMNATMSSPSWVQGAIYLPMGLMAVSFGLVAAFLGAILPRWLVSFVGFLITGSALVLIPFCKSPTELIFPMALLGIGFGTLDSTLSALAARFGHERHGGMYATSVVLSGAAFSSGFALGPTVMGLLINIIGFYWLIIGMGCTVSPFAGFCLILRYGENQLDEKAAVDNREREHLVSE